MVSLSMQDEQESAAIDCRNALRTHVHQVKYVEIDWQDGRTIIVKKERQPYMPALEIEDPKSEPKASSKRKKRGEEGSE